MDDVLLVTGPDAAPRELVLDRWPPRSRQRLRAWDAADEYLLHHLDGLAETGKQRPRSVLLVNDAHGALATALATTLPDVAISSWTDSAASVAATRHNLRANDADPDAVEFTTGTELPAGRVDQVLIKVPKALALLGDQFLRLRPGLGPDSAVLAAAMAKHVHRSTIDLFEQALGPTTTSLARKKARLLQPTLAPDLEVGPTPWPRSFEFDGLTVVAHAGVFGSNRVDPGTRLLLDHLPDEDPAAGAEPARILDLGCGTGIVGMAAARRFPEAEVTCIDDSFRAVASAQATFAANGAQGQFKAACDLAGIVPESIDVVLLNPPFHDDQAVSDETAWAMFGESRKALRPGGELLVVGNRHLAYHAKLKRLFGNCKVVASNPRFVVYRSIA